MEIMKYIEIFKFANLLCKNDIDYEMHQLYDGFQILVPINPNCNISFIEHFGSYGSSHDLIEAWAGFEPTGNLNAGQAYEYYINHRYN